DFVDELSLHPAMNIKDSSYLQTLSFSSSSLHIGPSQNLIMTEPICFTTSTSATLEYAECKTLQSQTGTTAEPPPISLSLSPKTTPVHRQQLILESAFSCLIIKKSMRPRNHKCGSLLYCKTDFSLKYTSFKLLRLLLSSRS
ncbi:hypothetical protein GOODEAATRI_012015, partial [Goodea atripinnis]